MEGRNISFTGEDAVPTQNVRDPDKMYDPHLATGIGDAVFDAGLGSGWQEAFGGSRAPFTPGTVCDAGEGSGIETFYITSEQGDALEHAGTKYLQENAP